MTNGFERKKEEPPKVSDFSQIDPALLKESETWPINDYGSMAAMYEEAMGADIAAIIAPIHRRVIGSEFQNRDSVCLLDVCCGTGSYLREMSRMIPNSELFGLDISPEQITVAQEKSEAGISYIVGDATKSRFPDRCDIVTMNLDTMNHLQTPEDWAIVHRNVHGALKPDGLFLFDINTQKRLQADLNFPEVIAKTDMMLTDLGVNVEQIGDFVRQQHLMRAFKKMPSGMWQESHARIQHIAPTEEKLYSMLEQAGFSSWQEIPLSEEERSRHIFLKNRLFIKARK